MKAMVLAAGEGTRLRPLTLAVPKPMAPIANIPLLERTLRWLLREDVHDVMVNLHYKPQVIQEYIGNGRKFGVNVEYSHEEQLLGTAGAVKKCESFFSDAPFLVVYGDNLLDVRLQELREIHESSGAEVSIGLFRTKFPTACGLVDVDQNHRVSRFVEKPPVDEVFTDRANAGVYVVSPSVLAKIKPHCAVDFGKDVFPQILADGGLIVAVDLDGYLQDTGTIDTYRDANTDLLKDRTFAMRGRLVANPPNFTLIGEGAHLSPDISFEGVNIVGARCRIGSGCYLKNCILWEDVEIGDQARLENVIVGTRGRISSSSTLPVGAVIAAEEDEYQQSSR